MLSRWFDKIASTLEPDASRQISATDIERVSALLLVEIARADHDIDTTERAAILAAMEQASTLPETELREVVAEAFNEADSAVSLHEHVSIINSHFDKRNKLALVEQMWRVALADGSIDGHEEYTIRKLCDLIHIKHRDFMQAKLRVIGD
ncbi:MAG: TerB family tellurite resistance protein [Granulosicoccus sp.]|nr:TerB family tellurite resistance protein [Granulosicoccus sp.]